MTILVLIVIIATALLLIQRKDYLRRVARAEKKTADSEAGLTALVQQKGLQLWTYDTDTGMYNVLDDHKKGFVALMPEKFAKRYTATIYEHIGKTLQTIIRGDVKSKTLHIAQTVKSGDKHYYALDFTVLRRDDLGQVKVIVAVQKDITDMFARESREKELTLRYNSVKTAIESFDDIYAQQQAIDEKDRQLLQAREKAYRELTDYISNIDFAMKTGGIHMAQYSPDDRHVTIYSGIDNILYRLKPDEVAGMVDMQSSVTARRMIGDMDCRAQKSFDCHLRTNVLPTGQTKILHVTFIPITDDAGHVTNYFGMLRDITELKAKEWQLTQETIRARREETAKNSFMRNMSFEIRTPLNSVVGFADLFRQEHTAEEETVYSSQIKTNATRLLMLINDILFLSRIDAGMIESKKRSVDFTAFLTTSCQAGWGEYQKDGVSYEVTGPEEPVTLNIDTTNLSIVIGKLCTNAAQHTTHGHVRAAYEYLNGTLTVTLENNEDANDKMSPDILSSIFERFGSAMQTESGLSMPVCHEVMTMLGGTIDVAVDSGIVRVTLTLPCEKG